MGESNKKKSTKNHKKEDGTFHSKHINHDPQAESSRTMVTSKVTSDDK
ncbi:MAG: CPC_1213 family protein [Bacillota bacterium]|nr:CPC_1213 family protein [Bacillota bacterium]